MHYFLELAYRGTQYGGWQKQEEVPSVQATLDAKISLILRDVIETYGCGRTDTGVHASYFVAQFDFQNPLPPNFVYRLNGMLPDDIVVYDCREVDAGLHARFSAISRTYQYRIIHQKNPFQGILSWHFPHKPDIDLMNKAAALLFKTEEYRCFCKGKTKNESYRCRVTEAYWAPTDQGLVFTVAANRFLRSMVRSMVGTLLKVGLGKMSMAQFEEMLQSGKRESAGKSAPAEGLYLVDVKYIGFTRFDAVTPPPVS